jgi:hemerythrin superfamily protein
MLTLRHQDNKTLAIGAAAGLAVGLAANAMRKVVVQAPTFVAGRWDEALAAEHKATLALFDQIQKTTDAQTTRRNMMLMQLKHALAKHAFQEENTVYPALRDHAQTEAADHLNHDHGYVKQYLYELTIMPRDDASWLPTVREFRMTLEKHMHEEEDTVFPKLYRALSAEDNKALTTAMNKEGLKVA